MSEVGGLSFAFTGEQRALQELAHEFAQREIRPRAAEHDASEEHPADLVMKAHEVGLMNLQVPAGLGGPGLGTVEGLIVDEELYWGCAGIATAVAGNMLASAAVLGAGSDEQQRAWLGPLVEEPLLCSFCLSEPNVGSDVSAVETTATRHRSEYVLSGAKTFVTNAPHAAWFVVFASTGRSAGRRGLTAFLVAADADGVSVGGPIPKMGQRAAGAAPVIFDEVRIPVANRLGAEGEGFPIAMRTLDATRPRVAIAAVGVARAACEHARRYSLERIQFGQPIAKNQGVSFLIADMATKIEAARLLCWRAAWLVDGEHGRSATVHSAMAKRFAADTCMEVTTDAVQVFGGYGYSREYPVEKLMRDAKVFQIYEGTSQIQRVVIAREVLRG